MVDLNLAYDEKLIARIISNAQGRSQAVQVKELVRRTGIDERRVREIVKQLIEDHCLPIGSTSGLPGGYYMIADAKELRQVRRSLVRRAVSILNRARVYDKAGWVKEMAGQLAIRLEEEEESENGCSTDYEAPDQKTLGAG